MQEQTFSMTREQISAYLAHEQVQGISLALVQRRHRFVWDLYEWLPEGKPLDRQWLDSWRQSLYDRGYAPDSVSNYIKGVNRYLVFIGQGDLRFGCGRPKDLTNKQFGYLTALLPIGETNRGDRIWRCRCQCGRETEIAATRLLTGSTMSCGCLKGKNLQQANQYIDRTSLRAALDEQVESSRASSGYTGVAWKRGKWCAYITYKGTYHSLGSYSRLEDAVKARARGKEWVQEDARQLLQMYALLHQEDPMLPDRSQLPKIPRSEHPGEKNRGTVAKRSDNTSGCTGVIRKRNRWLARITWKKVTYSLGSYPEKAQAIEARKAAELQLKADPEEFLKKYTAAKTAAADTETEG